MTEAERIARRKVNAAYRAKRYVYHATYVEQADGSLLLVTASRRNTDERYFLHGNASMAAVRKGTR